MLARRKGRRGERWPNRSGGRPEGSSCRHRRRASWLRRATTREGRRGSGADTIRRRKVGGRPLPQEPGEGEEVHLGDEKLGSSNENMYECVFIYTRV
jgi:hypothetical protein